MGMEHVFGKPSETGIAFEETAGMSIAIPKVTTVVGSVENLSNVRAWRTQQVGGSSEDNRDGSYDALMAAIAKSDPCYVIIRMSSKRFSTVLTNQAHGVVCRDLQELGYKTFELEPDPQDFGSFISGSRPFIIAVRGGSVHGRPLVVLNSMKVERGPLSQLLNSPNSPEGAKVARPKSTNSPEKGAKDIPKSVEDNHYMIYRENDMDYPPQVTDLLKTLGRKVLDRVLQLPRSEQEVVFFVEQVCKMNAAGPDDDAVIDLSSLKGAIDDAKTVNMLPSLTNRSAMWARRKGRELEFGELRRALLGTETPVFGNEQHAAEDAKQLLSRSMNGFVVGALMCTCWCIAGNARSD